MPSPAATVSTLQVGTYNPTLDTWSLVLDLNDRSNFYIRAQGLKLDQPEKVYASAFTMRAPGEKIVRWQYKNRHVLASIWIRGSTTAAITTNVRNLLSAIEQPPYRLKIALPAASGFSYADVVKVTHNIPSDAQEILGGAINHVELDFECLPGLSADQASGGTRLTLSNLLMNPGFEAPASPSLGSVQVFGDFFTNFNAYTVQAGGALVADKFQYADTVLADKPLRYYRLDEASGGTAYEAMGSGLNGTYQASPTLASTGLLTSDTDKAITLNGTSQYVSAASTNLPTGSGGGGTWSMEAWVKPTVASAFAAMIKFGGNSGSTGVELALNSSNQPYVAFAGGTAATSAGALVTGTTYHLVGTYDGTNLRLYQNGSLVAGPTAASGTLGTAALALGAQSGGGGEFWKGVLDECAIYNTTLSGTRVTAHYNAGTNAPSNASTTMQIPAAGRVSFGSPNWSSVNLWQVRWRWITGLTATFYLHYTDANNYLAATVSGTTLSLVHVVASATNTLGTQSINLTNAMQYWLQFTQFPNVNTSPMPQAQVVLKADSGGATANPSATIATISSVALASAAVATSGAPQIAATGATLGIGGSFSAFNMNEILLFGPGGWSFSGAPGVLASEAAGAWEQTGSNTYPNGPVSSFAAARVDAPPTGSWTATWTSTGQLSGAGAPNNAPALNTQVMAASVWVKTSGMGSGVSLSLVGNDADSGGSFLRSTTLQTVTGNQSGWTQLSGTWTAGASTALAYLTLVATDSTSGSANGIVWWDNAQLWNQTRTGLTSMPYCELRFPGAPAQLVVSGLLGDMPASTYLACGIWLASLATNSTVVFGIGRRASVSASAQLVGNLQVYQGNANAVLDQNSYGGYYLATASNATSVEYDPPTANEPTINNLLGTWHYFARAQSSQATIANVACRLNAGMPGPWVAYGSQIAPLMAASTWAMVDEGQVAFPIGAQGALTPNPTTQQSTASTQWSDSTGGGSTISANWYAYVPVDTNLVYGTVLNPSNAGGAITSTWFFVYNDALGPLSQVGVALRQSQEVTAADAPFASTGGSGTLTSTYPSVNATGDPYLTLDPSVAANTTGVNQLVVVCADNNGTVLPVAIELRYAPQYLYPK